MFEISKGPVKVVTLAPYECGEVSFEIAEFSTAFIILHQFGKFISN